MARPEAASNSEMRSGRNSSPTRSPTDTLRLAGNRAFARPCGSRDGDDLCGAEIFRAENLAAQRGLIVQAHMLGTHAEDQIARRQALARRRNGDLGAAKPDPGAAGLQRVVEGQAGSWAESR